MNEKSVTDSAGTLATIFAVLSVAVFWLLPFSPLVAMVAVVKTRHSKGWPQSLAKAGALLSTICTMVAAALLLWLLFLACLRGWNFAF